MRPGRTATRSRRARDLPRLSLYGRTGRKVAGRRAQLSPRPGVFPGVRVFAGKLPRGACRCGHITNRHGWQRAGRSGSRRAWPWRAARRRRPAPVMRRPPRAPRARFRASLGPAGPRRARRPPARKPLPRARPRRRPGRWRRGQAPRRRRPAGPVPHRWRCRRWLPCAVAPVPTATGGKATPVPSPTGKAGCDSSAPAEPRATAAAPSPAKTGAPTPVPSPQYRAPVPSPTRASATPTVSPSRPR